MDHLPPEKYYEACITYHIVNYYQRTHSKKVLPFSISQMEEHEKGYDFGYYFTAEEIFYIQYKRPNDIKLAAGEINWKINLDQLKTIIEGGLGDCTYYALPGFRDITEWYEGLDKTYFTRADDLYTYLRLLKKLDRQSAVIDERVRILRKFEDYFGKEHLFLNVLAEEKDPEINYEIYRQLPEQNLWGYLVGPKGTQH